MTYELTYSSMGWGFKLWIGCADNGWHGYYDTRADAVADAQMFIRRHEQYSSVYTLNDGTLCI